MQEGFPKEEKSNIYYLLFNLHSINPHKIWPICIGMRQKRNSNKIKKIKIANSKKLSFSTTTKSWPIFAKISKIGPGVRKISWCEGQLFCSTSMVVRLSDVSSIYCIFCTKLSLHRWSLHQTAWRQFEVSINKKSKQLCTQQNHLLY